MVWGFKRRNSETWGVHRTTLLYLRIVIILIGSTILFRGVEPEGLDKIEPSEGGKGQTSPDLWVRARPLGSLGVAK